MEAIDCCVDNDKLNGTVDELNNECSAVLPSYGPTPVTFNLDDACYYYSQEYSGSDSVVDPTNFSNFFQGLGSFLNNLLGIGGFNPAPTTAGSQPVTVEADKSRRNTLIILGIVTAVVLGYVGYTLYKKSK